MLLLRCLAVLAIFAVWSVPGSASAGATSFDPSGFRLQSSRLYVHENAGQAVVTVERGNGSQDAQIRYVVGGVGFPCGAQQCTATRYDFTGTKGVLDFPPGVRSETFSIPIVDHGTYSLPKTTQISLFGPSPIGMASPFKAVLAILDDDPLLAQHAGNPLGVPNATPSNPLAGATFYVNPDSVAALAARRHPALEMIAREPGTARFGNFSWPDSGIAVSDTLAKAQVLEPGTVPMLATYRVVDGHCGHWSDRRSDQAAYHNFIVRFSHGIGDYRAVLFLEMDSIITTPCLSPHGLAVRMHELHGAISILTANCPRLVIYLDAGAADAIPARQVAHLLGRAGIAGIEGFFLNSTHFDWTSKEIRFGEQVSRMTGGKHFVVNTGENGRGPLRPADIVRQGNEVLCNPTGRGLGPLPTTNTGYPNLNAFAWTSNPGESGGACVRAAPPAGAYWPAYALMLVRNAVLHVDSAPQ